MKATTIIATLTLALASLATAAPVAEPEPVSDLQARQWWSAWAFYVSSGTKCSGTVYSDAGTSGKGCTNISAKGGSVNFVSASTGSAPWGTFYSELNCKGTAITARDTSSCVAGTIKSYKVNT